MSPHDPKRTAIGSQQLHPESQMMSYGFVPSRSEGSVKVPLFLTSTFSFATAEEGKAFFEVALGARKAREGEDVGLIYTRANNPNLEIVEDRLTLWDKAENAAVFASGMAAISTAMLTFLRPGDLLLHSDPVYGGTDYLIKHILPEFGVKTYGFRCGTSAADVERDLRRAGLFDKLRMIHVETPANPTNALVDIAAFAAMKRTAPRNVVLSVDNTFLGPLWQHPLEHGADLVLYSATKYIGGHSDVIAGVCLGSHELMGAVKGMRTMLGTMASPHTAWLLTRSLETLKLRMESQERGARVVADYLRTHPKIAKVHYLGHLTEADADYAVFKRQCLGPGAMISFDLHGGEAEAFRFLNHLTLIHLAVSLGGTESLAEHPGAMTHSELDPEERIEFGIGPNMVRLSVGVEHPDDLIADLAQALEYV